MGAGMFDAKASVAKAIEAAWEALHVGGQPHTSVICPVLSNMLASHLRSGGQVYSG